MRSTNRTAHCLRILPRTHAWIGSSAAPHDRGPRRRGVQRVGGAGLDPQQKVRRILRRARLLGRDAFVPSLVLAELYRGRGRNQLVDACLARERGSLDSRDTDRHLARIVGGVLAAAGAGSTMIVDAHVIALAVEAGGGVVVTGDEPDLDLLSAPYRHIVVEPV